MTAEVATISTLPPSNSTFKIHCAYSNINVTANDIMSSGKNDINKAQSNATGRRRSRLITSKETESATATARSGGDDRAFSAIKLNMYGIDITASRHLDIVKSSIKGTSAHAAGGASALGAFEGSKVKGFEALTLTEGGIVTPSAVAAPFGAHVQAHGERQGHAP